MVKFTNQQRLEIIKTYYWNSESVVATLRALTPIFGRNNRPTRHAFKIKLTQELKPLDHLKRRTIDLLKGKFGERVISRNGPVEWPPCSCDLMPLDFFLWGHIKSLVYANKPTTLDDLKDGLVVVIWPISNFIHKM